MITRRNLLQGSIGALALGGGFPNILRRALAAQAAAEGRPTGACWSFSNYPAATTGSTP